MRCVWQGERLAPRICAAFIILLFHMLSSALHNAFLMGNNSMWGNCLLETCSVFNRERLSRSPMG